MPGNEPESDGERFWPFYDDSDEDEDPPRPAPPRRTLSESVLPLAERRRPSERRAAPARRPLTSLVGRAGQGGERRSRSDRRPQAQAPEHGRPVMSGAPQRGESQRGERRLPRVSFADAALMVLTVMVLVLVYLALI